MSEWKPIETAPKDGRPVWVKGNNKGDESYGQHYAWAYWDGSCWINVGSDECWGALTYLIEWLPNPFDCKA
jgi:hypothetical protein